MKMIGKLLLPIAFLLLVHPAVKCEPQTMLIEFLDHLQKNQPTKITAFLCWDKKILVELWKQLSDLSIPINYETEDVSYQQPLEHQLFLLDYNCSFGEDILNLANKLDLFDFPFRWVILNLPSIHKDYNMFINSRIYLIQDYGIISPYKVATNMPYIYNNISNWRRNKFDAIKTLVDSNDRSNLFGLPINISIVYLYEDTVDHLDDMMHRNIDAITKHNYLLVKHIVEILNVTPSYVYQRTWGTPDPKTKLYNGLMGDLQSKSAEIGGTASFFTNDRISIVDYVGFTTPTRAKFIFRAPPLSAVSNVFILPFNTWVWYSCMLMLIIIFFVIYFIIKFEWLRGGHILIQEHGVLKPTVLDVIQMEIGAVCQQGSEAEPRSGAGKIATFLVFLSLMFLYTSYSANIVALLQSTTDSIKTLDDMLKSKMTLGVEETPYSRYYFQIQNGPTQKAIRETKVSPPNKPSNYMPLLEGVKKLREEFFGFHSECDTVYKVISNTFSESEKCGLQEIEYWAIPDPWVPIKKNSTFKEIIKIGYKKMKETGVQSRNFERIYSKKPKCHNQGANFKSVNLNDCYFAFAIFLIGFFISLMVFTIELIVAKNFQKTRMRAPTFLPRN